MLCIFFQRNNRPFQEKNLSLCLEIFSFILGEWLLLRGFRELNRNRKQPGAHQQVYLWLVFIIFEYLFSKYVLLSKILFSSLNASFCYESHDVFATLDAFQFWIEGIALTVVASIGLLGNLLTVIGRLMWCGHSQLLWGHFLPRFAPHFPQFSPHQKVHIKLSTLPLLQSLSVLEAS